MDKQQTIKQAKLLIEHLEAGNEQQAKSCLDSLATISESNLFKEIGKLTRDLHDTLNSFHLDTRLTSLATQDIPDAKDRLEYVMTLTADAANTTMDAVEEGISISDDIKSKAADLDEGWQKVRNKQLDGVQFRALCTLTEKFITKTANDSVKLHSLLEDALMAQGFQDLTGQVIKRVIQLVHEVEESLVETIKMFGEMSDYHETVSGTEKDRKVEASGPAMNADTRDDVVKSQDEVDDLLSSLGF
ncbi:MAG: protein phosphatase [Gammaproteobacteria bacterium]|nr:MAG: protein phosphatase [Gammaproteobacteria bacterium]